MHVVYAITSYGTKTMYIKTKRLIENCRYFLVINEFMLWYDKRYLVDAWKKILREKAILSTQPVDILVKILVM